MSRNLLSRRCVHCDHEVELLEDPRPITKEDAGPYFDEFRTLEVADAECPACKAKYLAWVNPPTQGVHKEFSYGGDMEGHFDLSYRSTFNDEPSEEDLPVYEVEKQTTWMRVGRADHRQSDTRESMGQISIEGHERYDLVSHLHRQRDFSLETFGPGERVEGVIGHIWKELKEVEDEPSSLEEWIDIALLAFDGAWRQGYTPGQVAAALEMKLEENKSRDWPDWREQGLDSPIEHEQ